MFRCREWLPAAARPEGYTGCAFHVKIVFTEPGGVPESGSDSGGDGSGSDASADSDASMSVCWEVVIAQCAHTCNMGAAKPRRRKHPFQLAALLPTVTAAMRANKKPMSWQDISDAVRREKVCANACSHLLLMCLLPHVVPQGVDISKSQAARLRNTVPVRYGHGRCALGQ